MSDANIESLFQITAPRPDRIAPTSSRDRQALSAFSDQLSLLNPSTASRRPGSDTSRSTERTARTDVHSPADSASDLDAERSRIDYDREPAKSVDQNGPSDSPPAAEAEPSTEITNHERNPDESDPEEETENVDDASAAAVTDVPTSVPAEIAAGSDSIDLGGAADAASSSDGEDRSASGAKDIVSPGNSELHAGSSRSAIGASDLVADVLPTAAEVAAQGDEAAALNVTTDESLGKTEISSEVAAAQTDAQLNADTAPPAQEGNGASAVNAKLGTVEQQSLSLEAANSSGNSTAASTSLESHNSSALAEDVDESAENELADGRRSGERTESRGKESNSRTQSFAIHATAATTPPPVTTTSDSKATHAADTINAADKTLLASSSRTDAGRFAQPRGSFGVAALTGEIDEAAEASRVDAARFVGRVTRAFHFAQERGGTLQLRLSPPELGSLRLELTVKEGVLSASLEAETPAARRLLLDHLPVLRDRLAEQNIRVERFDVDIRRDGQEGQRNAFQQEQQDQAQERQHQHANSLRSHARRSASDQTPAPLEPVQQPATGSSGINLVI